MDEVIARLRELVAEHRELSARLKAGTYEGVCFRDDLMDDIDALIAAHLKCEEDFSS